jgi:hypothetical protein
VERVPPFTPSSSRKYPLTKAPAAPTFSRTWAFPSVLPALSRSNGERRKPSPARRGIPSDVTQRSRISRSRSAGGVTNESPSSRDERAPRVSNELVDRVFRMQNLLPHWQPNEAADHQTRDTPNPPHRRESPLAADGAKKIPCDEQPPPWYQSVGDYCVANESKR